MQVTILSGTGRYADPWHDFTGTSAEIARVLARLGLDVTLAATTPDGLRTITEADLLVVNAGGGTCGPAPPERNADDGWDVAFDALRAHRAQRRPLLAVHAAANSLHGLDEWPCWIGGRWIQDRSMHPPIDEATVQVSDHGHPITAGLTDFTVFDERYTHLEVGDRTHGLLHHRHEDVDHPLVWVVEIDGTRAAYDALGHDVRSYASRERTDLLHREARWLLQMEEA